MNNVIDCGVILDNKTERTGKNTPIPEVLMNVGEGRPQTDDIDFMPFGKPRPNRVWEIKEMINKLSLYQKGATGPLVICYKTALDALCEIDKLEFEKEQREARQCLK